MRRKINRPSLNSNIASELIPLYRFLYRYKQKQLYFNHVLTPFDTIHS